MKKRDNLKQRLKAGETVIGTWNVIPSPAIVEITGNSGLDFLVIDAEHGPVSMESAEGLVRAAEAGGTTPIIRVPNNRSDTILRALDIGAYGVQVPHVSTKKEAELVVEYSMYHPKGKRGLSPFTRAGTYGINAEGHTARSNENTMVIINIEGTEGIRNLPEILSVLHIDVVFIGPYDLSQSLGKPGHVNAPEIIDTIKKSSGIIREKGMACGSFANDMNYLKILIDCGVQYITYMVDTAIISQSYQNIEKSFRELLSGREGK